MKGWRETGIVFYVLKPVRPGSPPKSELWVTPEGYILGIYSLRFHFWLLKVKLKYFKKVLFGFFFLCSLAFNRSGTFMSDTFTDGDDASDSGELR